LPGGGPELAMKTVEKLMGVPINYYAQIDFNAFIKFIDEIGGIKLDIKEPIKVDLLGDNTQKKLKPGIQVLNGQIALDRSLWLMHVRAIQKTAILTGRDASKMW